MSRKNKLNKRQNIKAGKGVVIAKSPSRIYLKKLREHGMIDMNNHLTPQFLDMLIAFVTLPVYEDLVEALGMPVDAVIISHLIEMLINKKSEHAIYVLFELIYSFTRSPMPQALNALTEGGLTLDFAALFLADLTDIIREEFDKKEVAADE